MCVCVSFQWNLCKAFFFLFTSDTMMSICRRSFLSVFISCSGSLWIPTQQPLTKILVALQTNVMTEM